MSNRRKEIIFYPPMTGFYTDFYRVCGAVMESYKISAKDFYSDKKIKTINNSRRTAIWILNRVYKYNFAVIAGVFQRSSSTMLQNAARAEAEWNESPTYKNNLIALIRTLYPGFVETQLGYSHVVLASTPQEDISTIVSNVVTELASSRYKQAKISVTFY